MRLLRPKLSRKLARPFNNLETVTPRRETECSKPISYRNVCTTTISAQLVALNVSVKSLRPRTKAKANKKLWCAWMLLLASCRSSSSVNAWITRISLSSKCKITSLLRKATKWLSKTTNKLKFKNTYNRIPLLTRVSSRTNKNRCRGTGPTLTYRRLRMMLLKCMVTWPNTKRELTRMNLKLGKSTTTNSTLWFPVSSMRKSFSRTNNLEWPEKQVLNRLWRVSMEGSTVRSMKEMLIEWQTRASTICASLATSTALALPLTLD